MFILKKIENAKCNVPEPEYLTVGAAAIKMGEALKLSSGALVVHGGGDTDLRVEGKSPAVGRRRNACIHAAGAVRFLKIYISRAAGRDFGSLFYCNMPEKMV